MSDKSNNSGNANELLLARLLENCKKNRIKDIAERYNIKLSEKFTKQQMIDAVLPVIEVNFGIKLKHYSVHDLHICMECLTENEISQEAAERIMDSVPFGDGAVYITSKKNEFHAFVPHELAGKIMMRCVTDCFLGNASELDRSALASAAIYGCFTPQMLADVAISAYALDLTEKQAEEYLLTSSCDVFSYKNGKAFSESLPSFNIHPQAVDEQYYIPTRGEVESYATYGADSSDYYFRQIVNFIYNNPDITYDRAESLLREIADWCRSDSDFSDILKIITQSDIVFSPDKYNFLLGMMGELYNRTRKPTLKGHSPDEIEGVKPIIIPGVQIAAVKNAPIRVENKIGRNDPCPCGSGKKYKKCCGKNR